MECDTRTQGRAVLVRSLRTFTAAITAAVILGVTAAAAVGRIHQVCQILYLGLSQANSQLRQLQQGRRLTLCVT
jgi:hypothetical protein